jgi:tetratricopeptide (TPR) repeat protein
VELEKLKRKLLVDKDCQKVAISGLGGIGKTQIALQFAYYVKESCPEYSLFWVQALSMETFEQGYIGIANELGIQLGQDSEEDVRRLVQQRLCAKNARKWLLIVDNVDDLDLLRGLGESKGLQAFLPENENGLTIFTTRYGLVAQHLVGNDVVEIREMAAHETMDLLETSLIRKNASDNEIAMDLIRELEYLPLAVTQAAAYINVHKSSVADYLRLLKSTEQDARALMDTDCGDRTRYENLTNAVAKTWSITFNKIIKRDPLAADILAFISCIEWKEIPHSILPKSHPEALLEGALGTLCSYSFLERRDDNKFDMHRLVHLATRMWVNQNGRESETMEIAIKHLVTVFPSRDYGNQQISRAYLPHVARITKDEHCQDTFEKSELCLTLGIFLLMDGRYQEAVTWLQECCKWRDKNLAEDDNFRLLSQDRLAVALRENGQIKESIKLLEQVVARSAKVTMSKYYNPLISQHELAISYRRDKQVSRAIRMLEQVVDIRTKTSIEDDPDRLASQHELAVAYASNLQAEKAVELLEHIIEIKTRVQAENNHSLLSSQHELARAYLNNGEIERAIKLFEHVVKLGRNSLAENHPVRLTSQHELGRAYLANGQVKEAIKLLEHIVTIRRMFVAESHHSRLESEIQLARAYRTNGQIEEAEELFQHASTIMRKFGQKIVLQ